MSQAQKSDFKRQGYIVLRDAVSPRNVHSALRAINHSLGSGLRREDIRHFLAQSFCRELQSTPVICDLLKHSKAWPAAESLIGPGKIHEVDQAQIALRFPSLEVPPPEPVPHIDGMSTQDNNVRKGTIDSFTALVGVFLSDVKTPDCGNFTVYPGSHLLLEEHFRTHTPQSLLKGMPAVAMPEGEQVLARAGDVIIAHYQLAHGVAANLSPHIRYAAFFRLHHVDHHTRPWATMTDIWLEWEGLKRPAESESVSFPERDGITTQG